MSSIFNYQIEANRDVEQIATENLIFLKKCVNLDEQDGWILISSCIGVVGLKFYKNRLN